MQQLELFPTLESKRKARLGHSQIEYKESRSILTKASGFMDSYDYTLNPYSGCAFGCTYCYAAFFARQQELRDTWGYWVQVKENALSLLKKKRKRPLNGAVIYMSSVTDPYQPIEKELGLVRDLLQELADYHRVTLVIQTRSALVTRDIDLFKKIGDVQINMTITTDTEEVRKVFEPFCPSNAQRMSAIRQVHREGISACITMTPLLPITNAEIFAQDLVNTGIENFIIQPFHAQKGKFVAGTRDEAISLIDEMCWDHESYQKALNIIKQHIPNIGEGKDGFSAKR